MPISDCEVRDPRIRRTRQLLQGALQTLMQTKSFDEISVQDITETATVNRATFYDHYTDKFGLLEAAVAGGFHRLLHERKVGFDAARPQTLGPIVLAACDFLSQAHTGSDCHRQNAFEPLMDAAVTAVIRMMLIQGMAEDAKGVLPNDIVATAASWAIYGAVKQWFATPGRPAAKRIVQPIVKLVLPMMG